MLSGPPTGEFDSDEGEARLLGLPDAGPAAFSLPTTGEGSVSIVIFLDARLRKPSGTPMDSCGYSRLLAGRGAASVDETTPSATLLIVAHGRNVPCGVALCSAEAMAVLVDRERVVGGGDWLSAIRCRSSQFGPLGR